MPTLTKSTLTHLKLGQEVCCLHRCQISSWERMKALIWTFQESKLRQPFAWNQERRQLHLHKIFMLISWFFWLNLEASDWFQNLDSEYRKRGAKTRENWIELHNGFEFELLNQRPAIFTIQIPSHQCTSVRKKSDSPTGWRSVFHMNSTLSCHET